VIFAFITDKNRINNAEKRPDAMQVKSINNKHFKNKKQ